MTNDEQLGMTTKKYSGNKASKKKCPVIKSIHPFPARMAPEIVWDALEEFEAERKALDQLNQQTRKGLQ